jgi:hypothetical protein
LDCCNAGTANTNEGEGVTELISACAWNSTANGVGPYSFTNALVIELQDLAKKPCFSTGELYSNIFSRIQGRMPENGMERHPAPVHLVLTNDAHFPRSIQLSKRPISKRTNGTHPESTETSAQPDINSMDLDHEDSLQARGSTMSKPASFCKSSTQSSMLMADHHDPICGDKVPRLAFAIRLRDNFQVGELSTDLFLEWLRHIPTIAEQVKVEAGFDSFSSLLIVSIPISLSGYLPTDRAIISLGPIGSSNLITNWPRSHSPQPGLLDCGTETKNSTDSAISEKKPEASNFPTTHYNISDLISEQYPDLSKDIDYQVLKNPIPKKPIPIFPWELDNPKPTRVFPEDNNVGWAEPLRVSRSGSIPVDKERTEDKSLLVMPTIPTTQLKTANSWQTYTCTNAWDNVPEIKRYIRNIRVVGSPTEFRPPTTPPSPPLTPPPIKSSSFWGERGDREGEFPTAEGIPSQEDWVLFSILLLEVFFLLYTGSSGPIRATRPAPVGRLST